MKLWRRSSGHPEIWKKNFKVVSGFVCVCLDGWPHTETTQKPGLKHSRTWYHTICFEKLEEWVVYRVLTLMYWFVCVGPDRTADVSTRRLVHECCLPWHVWIDSRTSVKCVKDARCTEGSCGDVCVFYCHLKTYCGPSSETIQSPE
jgi:hypothetical protein